MPAASFINTTALYTAPWLALAAPVPALAASMALHNSPTLKCRPGSAYGVQYNDDPSINAERWTYLVRIRSETAIVTYTDVSASESRQRIYRLIVQ